MKWNAYTKDRAKQFYGTLVLFATLFIRLEGGKMKIDIILEHI